MAKLRGDSETVTKIDGRNENGSIMDQYMQRVTKKGKGKGNGKGGNRRVTGESSTHYQKENSREEASVTL